MGEVIFLKSTLVCFVGLIFISKTNATHFRGALFSWKPGSSKNEIIIDYRISWRLSNGANFYCNDSIIKNGDERNGQGSIACFSGCHGTLGSLAFQCTDYSTIEDWSSGKGRVIATLNTTNATFGFTGGDWISTLNVGRDGSWKLLINADLSVRPDTGRINSSPRAEITPIVRLQYNCNHTITIPVTDPDRDTIRCRWASDSKDECADVCNAFPHAYLDSDTCTLTYDALYSMGWYAVAIQVEDFANQYDISPLSSIPVQFLVQVYRSHDSCSVKPALIDPSPHDGDCIVVRKNETFETTITAHIDGYNRSIAEIKTVSPLGMVKSPLMQINASTWQINVTWTPTAINDTSNVFCFTATDTTGQQSDKRCITLLSGVSRPQFVYGSQGPTGLVSPDQRLWSIRVDRQFTRGSSGHYIRLYSERGSLLENIAASDRSRVSINGFNNSLEFRTNTTFHENQTYYFLFDAGVVRSNSYCGMESDSADIKDSFFWRIYTDAVPIRLVNGNNPYSGRVEIFHGGAWGTVCDDSFDRPDAEVICRMLGMLSYDSDVMAFQQAHFGQGSGRIVLDDLQCNGSESSLEDCQSSGWNHEDCNHNEDAGVSCNVTIRLVNGSSKYSGRVEVYHSGRWGTICDDSFGQNEARTVCRQLGIFYGDSHTLAYGSAYYGEGNGSIALDDLSCNGYEDHIWDCRTKAWFSNDCGHGEDAGVDCYAAIPIRLVNGNNPYSGRVEVFHGGAWGTVCDDSFDRPDAEVICRMLGMLSYDSDVMAFQQSHFGPGSGRIVLDDLQCNGSESSLVVCRSSGWNHEDCDHGEDAGVSCNVTIRLVNGSSKYSGRVEVYHSGRWGTICDDSFGQNEARTVCRQLGIFYGDSSTIAYGSAYYGKGNGSIALDDLNCNGYEDHIWDCRTKAWFSNDCGHGEDAGVDCYAYDVTTPWWYNNAGETTEVRTPIRLVNGPTYYSGRMEVYHNGAWGTVCDDDVNNRTVKVICKMLGMYIGDSYGRPYSSAHFGQGSGQIALDNLNCNGYETDITQCMRSAWYQNDCGHSEDAGVDCHGNAYGGVTLPKYSGYYTSDSYYTSTTYRPWYLSTKGYSLTDAIRVGCDENGWDIRVDLTVLRNIHPGAVASDIYLGENTCTGTQGWNTITFQQGLHECLTSQTIRNDVLMYRNQLVYAERDPIHSFIIRHYNWTVSVECDVGRNETSSGHIHHDAGNNPVDSVLGSSHYYVNMSFYSDPNFAYQISGNPIHVAVGNKVYIKVFTTSSDWTIKMRVHTCYTKPSATASDSLKFEMIKNGCEMDSNTHIISQSSHETRFVFEDFEYTSNHEGLYVYCDAMFCRSSDYSRQCMQTCNP
ncbi:deleted in malignant brain tumors 1 protein-like isoform X2 [Ruditapes philippinarum]|uniref:deleted in malignant brain tumors 1 protein-like isoform X2 n=1 Tax=Ruditapes philippinarum TaxID=129788 RepID=UPI00295A9A53|nr:deleted in malignant brain tumors 1 protein-like isoform X2 [Ruditapes philippinarum]